MYIKNFSCNELQIEELVTKVGEAWAILGDNRSGIDQLLSLLSGKLTDFSAEILDLPGQTEVISFLLQQEIFEEEIRNDDSDFLDRIDPGTLVEEFLPDHQSHMALLEAFGMDKCLQLGYRQLSSGQSRKLLFLQKLTGGATSLVIQNPYDGLDIASCHELNLAMQQLPAQGIELILLINSQGDIPDWCSHMALVKNGRIEKFGPKEVMLTLLNGKDDSGGLLFPPPAEYQGAATENGERQAEELISLKDGFAGYGEKKLFSGLHLSINSGDHTLITGPNGCGKSTLLDIITGDNPKCYANDLRIFGQKRGSGESIWELKKHMGIVSPSLHRDHRIPGSALQVILSGLYDSIGLYTKVSGSEVNNATKWLTWLSLADKKSIPFRRLSFAEQRLVLIGRALIKRPKLLILDEPTQGLDDLHRHSLLDLLEEIGERKISTILFVSHRTDEHRPIFRQQIHLDTYSAQ